METSTLEYFNAELIERYAQLQLALEEESKKCNASAENGI